MKGVGVFLNAETFMTPRLLAVAQMVKKTCCVADVGTDHAYVPVYLVTKNVADSAIAMDINEGPIMRADENIKKFSLCKKIKTRLCDGLSGLKNNEADTVIIAGMGGILINRILDADKDRLMSVKNFILQPMTAICETREYLAKNGFKIIDEKLAKEDEKIYTIILATRGDMDITDEIYYHVGACLIKNKDKILPEYLDGKIYEYEKAVSSMKNTKNEDTLKKAEHFEYLLSEFKRLKGECAKW